MLIPNLRSKYYKITKVFCIPPPILYCCYLISVMSDSFAIPWTVAHQAPLSMAFPRQEYQSGLPFPPPGHLPDPGIEPRSPALQADSLPTELPGKSLCLLNLFKFN